MSDLSPNLRDAIVRKGAKETAVDPESGKPVSLFNPRTQVWAVHFHWRDEWVVPVTAVGRASVAALAMNRPLAIAIRKEEMIRHRHPPA